MVRSGTSASPSVPEIIGFVATPTLMGLWPFRQLSLPLFLEAVGGGGGGGGWWGGGGGGVIWYVAVRHAAVSHLGHSRSRPGCRPTPATPLWSAQSRLRRGVPFVIVVTNWSPPSHADVATRRTNSNMLLSHCPYMLEPR